MDEISINAYVPLCEQYNTLAQSFYQQHLDLKSQLEQLGPPADFLENPILANAQMELHAGIFQAAICAVVFEAFAIESYVNFFGASTLGDDKYYATYESGEPGKRYSTIYKLKKLCKDEFDSSYPTDGKHFVALKGLFDKRNRLAHNKPKAHILSTKNGDTFDDYYDAMAEISFVYEGLEGEMALYDSVKEKLSESTKQPEPIAEYHKNTASAMAQSILQTIRRVEGTIK